MTRELRPKKHILCMAYAAWGHTRPMVSLAALIMKEPNCLITFMCIPSLFDRVHNEFSSHFPDKTAEEIGELVTIIAVSENGSEFMVEDLAKDYHEALVDAFSRLLIKCGKTGKIYPIHIPSVMFADDLEYQTFAIARKELPKSVKYFVFVPASAYHTLRLFGPGKYGGFGDLEAKTNAEMQRSGKGVFAASNAVFTYDNGSLVKLPGLPPFYDYEYFPQASLFPAFAIIYLQTHKCLAECDGAIFMASNELETGAIATLKEWFSETERPLYAIGPLLPLSQYKDGHNDLTAGELNDGKNKVIDFMDTTLENHGEKSMIYISFGTVFWSTRPEMIYSLIDELLVAGIPFLFTHASGFSLSMPEEVKEKVKSSGLGHLTRWCPQKNVLAHPVTGWFVSHCGQNSTLESISFGVPIIAWPFEFDQPVNAMLISLVHEIGYELMQVRTGEKGLRKPYRAASEDEIPKCEDSAWRAEMRDVFGRAFSSDGEKKRANVVKMRERMLAGWQEGGNTWNEFRAFLKYIDSQV